MAVGNPIPNQKLRYERERRAWSQQDVADKVGTTPLNVGRWERGITSPGTYFRQKLCEVFEKTAQELNLVTENIVTAQAMEVLALTPTISVPQEAPFSLWSVPYNRNLLFTGREDILAQLYDAFLNGEQPVALTQPQAISGLGGIGKTQTAVEYAYRYRDRYHAVLWARADSAELLTSDFLTMAALLNLPQRNEQDQGVVIKAVKHWFETHEGWLLILDNADTLEVANEFIPLAGKGHVLLTTRAHSTGTIAQRIEIEKMNLDEGIVFLLYRVKRLKGSRSLASISETIREQAQAIAEAVDGLPLALDQAGAYIEETGCSLSNYLTFFKTRRNRLLRMRGQIASGHPEPVATTWSLSIEKVEQANPAAAELLRLCAFLHPDEIPEAMLLEGAAELKPILRSLAEDELDWNEAIGELRKYSLLKRDSEEKILNIHRLVQVMVRDGMGKEEEREWAEQIVKMVNRVFPDPANTATWPLCQKYLPQAQMAASLLEQWNMAFPEAMQMLHKVGNYLCKRARYKEAEPILTRVLAIRTNILGLEHLDVTSSIDSLASLYYARGQYSQAESYYRQALSLRQKVLGPVHPEVASNLNHLAELYYEYGWYSQAENMYREALAILEQTLGPNCPEVAEAFNNIALVCIEQGEYEPVESFFERAIAINERVHKLDEVATNLNNFAYFYHFQGKYDQAELLYQRAIAIEEQIRGFEHPEAVGTLNNLGEIYYLQGKYEQAESLFQQALTIREKILESDHPHMAISLNSLGVLYCKQGKYTQAESFLQRGAAIRERAFGPEHPELSESLYNLAELYSIQRKYAEAELLFQRVLMIRERALGPMHPYVAQTLDGLAQMYTCQGLYVRAEPCFQRAIIIWEQNRGQGSSNSIMALEHYADLLRKTGRDVEAGVLEERTPAIRAKQGQAPE